MSSPAQLRYAMRATNGVYESLLEQVDTGGSAYLANCEYSRDFMHKTRWKDGFDFQTASGNEFRACIFGEIQRSAVGTKLSAVGSHFIGRGTPNYITDDTKVKNLFMIGIPTLCSTELQDRYHDQFVAINEIVEADRLEDQAANKMYTNKEAVVVVNTDYMFAVTSLPKYIVPRITPEHVPTLQRLLKHSRDVASSAEPDPALEDAECASGSDSNSGKKGIKVGDTYEPTVLNDYGGPLFQHVHSKLVQHDISTLDKRIIPPWAEYDALSEGTLVIITISVHTFIMPMKDNQGNFTGQERRVYQLNAHSILIVDESDTEAEPRYRPYTNEEAAAVTAVAPIETAADRALATFKVKKARHESPPATLNKSKGEPTSPVKASFSPNKTPVKPTQAIKQTKKTAVGKATGQRPTAKGKEKATSVALSKSTSETAESDSLADEDQIMAEVEVN
ncbi:uncharacterized protein LACBIDRAFT_318519 [Laccaria bicolor S238N-H82]|uniref:Predicted protein n=1 Tax=Laccaria bicolor (strain S238N-H82 / ATCC MYA-4686) TaxID=486041 RepID=B0E2L1_LACBS|nr:uncharacterized protein LACBIDRAFT_318519 [Laccaria bicolor S238N-H82]EDQ98913.1 predicted protein [Laccaria bicolor S238N-H82]|eukprot:XP_001890424.1 predicted protein [Laccaria bicolor S238N-H82]